MIQQADFLARRVVKESGTDHAEQAKRVFALAFQRAPSSREMLAALPLLNDHGLAALCRALYSSNEFAFIE